MTNNCTVAGYLVANALVRGNKTKALHFTVETEDKVYSYNKIENVKSYVPCCLFNPSEDIESRLISEGKGQFILLEGRVHNSIYRDGQQIKSNTEVIVNSLSVVLDTQKRKNY